MRAPMDHETCSALLRPYAEGRLEGADADAVREHLSTCPRCRAEEEVVRQLLTPVVPLSDEEAASLRSAVRRDARRAEAPVTTLPLRRTRRWGGLQLAGAAAVLIAAFVFARTVLPFGSGGADRGAGLGGAEDAASGQVAEIQDRLSFRRPDRTSALAAPVPDAQAESEAESLEAAKRARAGGAGEDAGDGDEATGSGGGAAAGGTTFNYTGGPPPPLYVRGAGRLDERRLRLVGRYGLPLVLFPRAYTVDDAAELQEDFLVRLANAAETEARSRQVIDCGAQVIAESTTAVPALATFGTYRGEPVFLLAFGWSEATTGPLDRFMVWTWPEGDCNGVPGYRAGRIGV